MKHRKIGQQLADAIAKAIADKAFEHLIPAAKKCASWITGCTLGRKPPTKTSTACVRRKIN